MTDYEKTYGKRVTVEGIQYPSRISACRAHGISYGTFNALLQQGRTVEDIFANPPNRLNARAWSEDEILTLRKYASTKTLEDIAAILGRTRNSVAKKSYKLGISAVKRNEHHHANQYSNLHVAMVHCLLDGGYSATEVAAFSDRARDSIKKIKYELTRTIQ